MKKLIVSLFFILCQFFVFGQEEELPQEIKAPSEDQYYFLSALISETDGNLNKAIDELNRAISLNPNSSVAYFKKAELLGRQKQYPLALEAVSNAIKIYKENSYYYLLKAQILERLGRNKEAVDVYKQGVKYAAESESDDFYFPLAANLLQIGKTKKALEVFDLIEKKYGLNPELTRERQSIYLKLNKINEAVAEGQKLIDAFPDDPEYKMNQAQLFYTNNRTDDALKLLIEVSEANPNLGLAQLWLAEIYRAKNDNIKSIAYLDVAFANPELEINSKLRILAGMFMPTTDDQKSQLINLVTKLIKAHPNDSRAHGTHGDMLRMLGRYEEARQAYLKAVKLPDADVAYYQQILNIDAELRQFDSVIIHAEQALEVFPNNAFIYLLKGHSELILKRYDKSVATLEVGLKLVDDVGQKLEFYSLLGDAYNDNKQYTQSENAYQKALEIDPDNQHVLNNYSYYLSLRKHALDRAVKMCERLIKLVPDDPTYLDTYGWVLFVKGNYKEAVDLLEKAKRSSKSGTIVEHYGDALFMVGRVDEAVEVWKQAKTLGDGLTDLIDKKIADRKFYE